MSMNNATLENCRIGFRNFSGEEKQYNRAGDRNFAIFLEPAVAEAMTRDGWNVKYLKQREDEDTPQAYIQVAVGYKGKPPQVNLISSSGRNQLGEAEVGMLDWVELRTVDITIRPYEWEVNGQTGVKAYLQKGYFVLEEDELDRKYSDVQQQGKNPSGPTFLQD